jgi:hypothetical protein
MVKMPSNSLHVNTPRFFADISLWQCTCKGLPLWPSGLCSSWACGCGGGGGGGGGSVYLNFPPIRKLDFVVLSDGRLYGLPIQSRS